MKNRIFPLLLVLMFLLCIMSLPALALESIDLNRKGTITVEPRAEYGNISGEVTLYRVADMAVTHGGYTFVYTVEFADAKLPLEDFESPELAGALAGYAAAHGIKGETRVFENNSAVFPATAGLYLVVHTGAREGENTFIPFLLVFPGTDKGQADYDVLACPKVGPLPDIPDYPDVPDYPTEPDETQPGATEPEPTEPGQTEPDGTEPEVTVPDETEPDSTQPDSTEPDGTEPEGTRPESTEPDSTAPGTDDTPPDAPEEEEKLPQTGQLNWPVPLLAAAGMSLFVAGWVLRFRDRKEDYDA